MSRAINFQTVSWFWDLYTRQLLELEPPYQRRSVWNQEYKDFFIDTVLNGYPAPAIFLYQEITSEGISKYSVVDGKQRLSALFEFAEDKFPVSEKATITRLRGEFFTDLENEVKQNFWKYQFAVEYIPSDNEKIINDIFDRINRNVSNLTPQELRHARFNGVFITAVEDLADWMISVLPENFPSIPSKLRKQMKDVEFVALLLLFLEEGVKSYRQDDFDKAFNDRDSAWDDKDEIEDEFKKVIESIKELLKQSPPNIDLCKTRLKNQADFYSLFGAIAELNREDLLNISSDISNRLYTFLEFVKFPERQMNIQEVQDYSDAITTSLGSAGIEKNKTRINILKSVISGTIDL
ncbi:DUF262 domain-containing protein [Cyanobacteria bacterium FACHB-472]|nr:DUF262 domain-containing protein [Cyanobacteria bacterium FACHB-472]